MDGTQASIGAQGSFGEYDTWAQAGGPRPPGDGARACKAFWVGYNDQGTIYLNSRDAQFAYFAGRQRARVEPGLAPKQRV